MNSGFKTFINFNVQTLTYYCPHINDQLINYGTKSFKILCGLLRLYNKYSYRKIDKMLLFFNF